MAVPRDLVSYHDPYEDDDLMITLLDGYNPNLADLDSLSFSQYPHSLIPQSGDHSNGDSGGANDLLTNQVLWDLGAVGDDPHFTAHSQTSRTEANTNYNPQQDDNNVNIGQPQNPDHCAYGNAQPLSVWPVPPLPYTCSCCQVLREIIHTNGNETMKLEVHGRLGMICHAVLVNQVITNGTSSSTLHPQMFDFCSESTSDVKQFLMEYCTERALAGYRMLQDPLSIFYEAICVGMDWDLFNDDFFPPACPSDSGRVVGEACQMGETNNQTTDRSVPKTSLAAQRERTGKLTLKDLVEYFHLPIEEAAKRLNLCPTVVKKICRRDGLSRWPHRKIKSMARQMSSLRENLGSYSPRGRANVEAEIDKLQQEITNIGRGVLKR